MTEHILLNSILYLVEISSHFQSLILLHLQLPQSLRQLCLQLEQKSPKQPSVNFSTLHLHLFNSSSDALSYHNKFWHQDWQKSFKRKKKKEGKKHSWLVKASKFCLSWLQHYVMLGIRNKFCKTSIDPCSCAAFFHN